MGIKDIVQCARDLEEAKFRLETLRNEKSNAQARIDQVNQALPAARNAVAAAKTALADAVTNFDAN